MERALLLTVGIKSQENLLSPKDEAKELRELALSTNTHVVDEIICFRESPTPNLYLGKGKIEEIKALVQEKGINAVVFNNDLSGIQQRNIEEIIGIKTIDRTQLILDIFARHAKSPEGRMQVELAQLEYFLPRLTGKGIFLSRLGGGIGTRGPGEQKLEIDRRRIKDKIIKLKGELQDTIERRKTVRKKRKESSIPTVALVGYTSAGKSTLMNALTESSQHVSQHLFTTLDPLSRSFSLSNNQKVVLSDTVGFINNLPPHLIEAFKATLEEVVESDLLLHVLDVSDLTVQEHSKAVGEILEVLGVTEKPIITVLNKIDKLEDVRWAEKYKVDFNTDIAISALHRQNLIDLTRLIEKKFENLFTEVSLLLPLNRMDLVDLIYREGNVRSIEYTPNNIVISATLPSIIASKFSNYRS